MFAGQLLLIHSSYGVASNMCFALWYVHFHAITYDAISHLCNHSMCPLYHPRLLHQSGHHCFGWCLLILGDRVKCIPIYLVPLESQYSLKRCRGQQVELIFNSGVMHET